MNSDSHNAARAPARIVGTDASSLDEAAGILLAGGLVAVPTETVYGVAADATNGAAVASIFTAKGRTLQPARTPPRRALLARPAHPRSPAQSRLPRA
jgi:hypothetical protein